MNIPLKYEIYAEILYRIKEFEKGEKLIIEMFEEIYERLAKNENCIIFDYF
jgi:hypothetical protein